MTLNGVLPLLHVITFIVFLAVLVAVVRRAAPDGVLSRVVLGGGLFLVALTAAGFAAEVAYPEMLIRFHTDPDPSLAQLMLALAIWCYH